MKFNERAKLDSSQVRVRRGGSKAAVGGGAGIVGVLVLLAAQFLGGGGGGTDIAQVLEQLNGRSVGQSSTAEEIDGCESGADANRSQDCRIVAVVNSIQDYWSGAIDGYRLAPTNFFTGNVTTGGCGSASSAVGPFYCPADSEIYLDLGFFDVLEERFGASGGDFAEAYVLAHEYGHHVQNLLGLGTDDRGSGPDSAAVRQELQADCFAGVWANHATSTPDPQTGEVLIVELTRQDIEDALSAAAAVGDDRIQESATGRVNPESWTHGSAEQRQASFMNGYQTGDPAACA